jgi:hypothetical protein
MSIIRVGLSETKDFSEGWDRIFGKKETPAEATSTETKSEATPETAQHQTPTQPQASTPTTSS